MATFQTHQEWKDWIGAETATLNRSGDTRTFLRSVYPTHAVRVPNTNNFVVGRSVQGSPKYHVAVIVLKYDEDNFHYTHTFTDVLLPNPSLSEVDGSNIIDSEFEIAVDGTVYMRRSLRYRATLTLNPEYEFVFTEARYKDTDVETEARRLLDLAYGRNTWECDDCGTVVHDSVAPTVYEGQLLCGVCSTSIITCWNCSETVVQSRDELRMLDCCNDCEGELEVCHSCGNMMNPNDTHTINGDEICNDCFHRDYRTCSSCGDIVHRHHMGSSRCNNCLPINGYGTTSVLEFQGGTTSQREDGRDYLGVEIELECDRSDDRNDVAAPMKRVNPSLDFKSDGSLNHGFEIVSQPATLQHHTSEHGAQWAEILRIARGSGCKSHDTTTCGIHVHVGRDSLDSDTEIKMAYFVNMYENFMKKFARRGYNNYAQKRVKSLDQSALTAHSRYDSFNQIHSATVEIRMFRGTLKESTFMATIEFVDALINFSRAHTYASFADEQTCVKKFIAYTEKKVRKYPHLYSYICERGIDTHYGYMSLGRQTADIQPNEVGVAY